MKRLCRQVQHILAERGPTALRDDQAAQRHLEECDECFGMLEALTALDAGFEAMPRMDAPDELVESLLAGVASAPLREDDEHQADAATRSLRRSWADAAKHGARQLFGPGRPRLKAAVAFALLAAIGPFILFPVMSRRSDEAISYQRIRVTSPEGQGGGGERAAAGPALATADGERSNLPSVGPVYEQLQGPELRALGYVADDPKELKQVEELGPPVIETIVTSKVGPITGSVTNTYKGSELPEIPRAELRKHDRAILAPDVPRTAEEGAKDEDAPMWVGSETDGTYRGAAPQVESDASGPFGDDRDQRARTRSRLRERLASLPRGLQDAEQSTAGEEWKKSAGDGEEVPDDAKGGKGSFLESVDQVEEHLTVTAESPAVDPAPTRGRHEPVADPVPTPAIDPAREVARRFLAERDATDAASRPATGYWTNTYVPGDPVLRYLQARLAGRDRSLLATGEAASAGEAPRLHDGARRTTQPFDPPTDAALAIQLHSDRSAVLGETRMLVQVGLAGTPRRGGRRPAMNVALVLDLRGTIPAETGASLIGLAGAFAEAQDLGDRFRLFAAGPGGGELLAPEGVAPEGRKRKLRRGPVTVAASKIVAREAEGPAVDLVEALRLAIRRVAQGDDPSAPLGSSAIVLATSRPLAAGAEALAELAHDSAVAGIPVSVIGVGDAVGVGELDGLALAGQGSRRLLRDPAEANGLVDRELAAAGRAVARAVRLRLSLAPGVRLIDVVGARRHDPAGAKRVRQAERAIDRRLARNLGLEADRGDDEAGIQIVIPTFYAGDRHAILLDVVVPGPGPVADVTVRFKDLVQLENAVARARLDVARGENGRGPLEHNVLKNFLAHRLREVLEEAGGDVALGDRESAMELLAEHRRLLAGLRLEVSGLDRDPDVGGDVAMLDEYVRVLGGQSLETPGRREYLADSLRYAGLLKVLPAPMPVEGAM